MRALRVSEIRSARQTKAALRISWLRLSFSPLQGLSQTGRQVSRNDDKKIIPLPLNIFSETHLEKITTKKKRAERNAVNMTLGQNPASESPSRSAWDVHSHLTAPHCASWGRGWVGAGRRGQPHIRPSVRPPWAFPTSK